MLDFFDRFLPAATTRPARRSGEQFGRVTTRAA